MKNKKRVLTILLVLICIILGILIIVTAVGGHYVKEQEKFKDILSKAACEFAEEENYTVELCNAYTSLCKVHYDKLIGKGKLDGNLKNPITKKRVSEDTKSYVEITWEKGKMICTPKEG